MSPTSRALLTALVVASAFLPEHAVASDAAGVLRSDLPLWSESNKGVWPSDCSSENSIAKCSIFAMGDWRRTEADCADAEPHCLSWVRLQMTAVFHARFGYSSAPRREELDLALSEISIIAPLNTSSVPRRLYALQIGFRGGSRYILLSVERARDHPIRHLTVLDPRCDRTIPGVRVRKAKFSSSYITEYCVAETKSALLGLAQAALNRPPLATLDWIADVPINGEEARP